MTTDITAAACLDTTIALCVCCGERPRLGALTRCKECLRADADQQRQATKACRTCKTVKPLEQFPLSQSGYPAKDGRRRDCRQCIRLGRTPIAPPPSPARSVGMKACRAKPEQREKHRRTMQLWL